MSSNDRKKKQARFAGIPFEVLKSPRGKQLRAPEVKLLIDILLQYHGRNNGMLTACHTVMKERGWAKSSLHRAYIKLLHGGFIVVTRQGWKQRGKPTLIAITWRGINEPGDGVTYDDDIKPDRVSLDYWSKHKSAWKHQPKSGTKNDEQK